jgi:uncharacterized membrane protein
MKGQILMARSIRNGNHNEDWLNRFGNYAVGFLAALGALVAAYFMPAFREMLISAAGTLAIITLFFTGEYQSFKRRLIGMVVAGVVLLAAFAMPDQAESLLSASGTIAILAIIFL